MRNQGGGVVVQVGGKNNETGGVGTGFRVPDITCDILTRYQKRYNDPSHYAFQGKTLKRNTIRSRLSVLRQQINKDELEDCSALQIIFLFCFKKTICERHLSRSSGLD